MGITSIDLVYASESSKHDHTWERSFEALAEIFDFVAGLVQRVPKKPSIAKADLQNSTADHGD